MHTPSQDEIDNMKLINFGESGHTRIEKVLQFLYKMDQPELASHVINLIRAHQNEKAKTDLLEELVKK